jgi:hypothetical protein
MALAYAQLVDEEFEKRAKLVTSFQSGNYTTASC